MSIRGLAAAVQPLLSALKSRRGYVQMSLLYLIERIIGIALSFAVYVVLARSYGPTILGTYSFVQTVMLFAVPLLAEGS